MRKYPVGMVLGGRYQWSDGTAVYQSERGHYWSASASSITYSYTLVLNGSNRAVDPAGYGVKDCGYTLRCLAQKGITTLKSFRLPTGGPSGEYQTLYNNYNSWTAMQDSVGPHFVLSGLRNGTSSNVQGTYGVYWSSSAYTSTTYAYNLFLYGTNSTVDPADESYKRLGFTLRCLAKKGITTLKSFRLPTGDPSGEYQTLYNNYNSYTAMTDPSGPHFVLSGWRDGTSPDRQGTTGYYWSSSAYTSANATYGPYLYGSTVHPASDGYKRVGVSLRCLGKNQTKNKKSPRLNKNKQIDKTKENGRKEKENKIVCNPSASQPVALLENTKLSTITIIAIPL